VRDCFPLVHQVVVDLIIEVRHAIHPSICLPS
jgi:hypothetical protein